MAVETALLLMERMNMKVLILAGGRGTRLSEETDVLPKPMVEIGGRPILWHIMKIYSHYGFNEFVILLGYKGYMVKEYFSHYFLHQSDLTIDIANNSFEVHSKARESWKVTLIDTGRDSMTGGRILRARRFTNCETFMLTYGDGLADIDIGRLLEFHRSHGRAMTMTIVQPEGRYGAADPKGDGRIEKFVEKPNGDRNWISGGFFICEDRVFDYLGQGDATVFERAPMEALASDGELYAHKHLGFWKCMDTLRDKIHLNQMWERGEAKWKVWE